MAVRIRIILKIDDKIIEEVLNKQLIALVNSGFESDEPDIIIPLNLAQKIELLSKPRIEIQAEAFAETIKMEKVEGVQIKVQGSTDPLIETRWVGCNILITDRQEEILISDKLSSDLGIIIIDAYKGKWRLRTFEDHFETKSKVTW